MKLYHTINRLSTKVRTKAYSSREEAVDMSVAGAVDTLLYAEIRDPAPSSNSIQNVAVPATGPTPRQYEDVLVVPKFGGDYQLTHNEAYGMTKFNN